MTSKERVMRAFRRADGLPDRVPFQFDLCKNLIDHFSKRLNVDPGYCWSYYEDLSYRISANELRTTMGSDVVIVGGEMDPAFLPKRVSENVTTNEFGMHMTPTDLYVEVVKAPLEGVACVEEIQAYSFPDPHAPGRFDTARREMERFGRQYFVIGDVEISIFEMAWHLSGMENYLIGMAAEQPWIEALNDRVEEWSMGIAQELADLGVDAIWFGEDLGTQTSTLISPDLWRRLFRPRYERMFAKLRNQHPELVIIMHSDGAVAPLLQDFIEMNVDVYNPVQPNVPGSDPRELKDKYGDRLCFFGGIDQQVLLPSGDEQMIREEMARRARILGEGRGYLMAPAHVIQADVSPQTVEIMCDAALRG
jgi:uroporphyrinogen decarboxylase